MITSHCVFRQPRLARFVVLSSTLVLLTSLCSLLGAQTGAVDFNRQIRPILSEHCYACHGPDQRTRKGGLRLDLEEDAFKPLKSGAKALVPGDLKQSALIERIFTADNDDVMPPVKGGKALSLSQKELLKAWVQQGARWKGHWAYLKPERQQPPSSKHSAWVRNEIDAFISKGLTDKGLSPSNEADKSKLIRRASLDLTGLPPTVEEVDAFVSDADPKAYEKLVDRLLDSKHYGEKMAQYWLDLARYGETQGYHHDAHRDMFHWRDWVINAFNNNLPFNQFTIDQLAGDLVPNPTKEQLIATGFHRNEMTTSEGGAIPEEYAVKYVVGRVDTTSRVWLGTSMACAECHDHKYDPISQQDYYRFFSYFNTIDEHGMDQSSNPVPRVQLSTQDHEKRLEKFKLELAALEAGQTALLDPPNATHDQKQIEWETRLRRAAVQDWKEILPKVMRSREGATLALNSDSVILVSGKNPPKDVHEIELETTSSDLTGVRLEAIPNPALPSGGAGRGAKGEFVLTRIELEAASANPSADIALFQNAGRKSAWHILPNLSTPSEKVAFDKDYGVETQTDVSKPVDSIQWAEKRTDSMDLNTVLGKAGHLSYFYRSFESKGRFGINAGLNFKGPAKLWLNGKLVWSRNSERPANVSIEPIQLRFNQGANHLLFKAIHSKANEPLELKLDDKLEVTRLIPIAAAVADHSRSGYGPGGALDQKIETGWSVGGDESTLTKPHHAIFRSDQGFGYPSGTKVTVRLFFQSPQPGTSLGAFKLALSSNPDLAEYFNQPDPTRHALTVKPEEISASQRDELRRRYRRVHVPEAKQIAELLDAKRSEKDAYQNSVPVAMIMREMEKPRETFLLVRGEYTNRGEKVVPGLPKSLFNTSEQFPPNRLGLARWLVHPDHPLTSRVIVNQFWQRIFGTGLVKSAEDFGSQGEWPSHAELLDWLATEFVRTGWNVKAIQKLIVTSATYRQNASVHKKALELDPDNRYLGRFPRQRLDAEGVRDTALAIAGLLDRRIGGPSVFPYQPPGLWEQVAFEGTRSWVQSTGADNYRRGLYTYWRRSVPYASFVTFDAPSRETCTVRRPRTNTPLQALVLMNDPVYVEAARNLGLRILKHSVKSTKERIEFGFRTALTREPTAKELRSLVAAFERERKFYEQNRSAASQLIHVGATPPPIDVDPSELAAWTFLGNILLNLDETMNKG